MHADDSGAYDVAWTWHLTPSTFHNHCEGGDFVWCSRLLPVKIAPDFNTLVLFRVFRDSFHAVMPVRCPPSNCMDNVEPCQFQDKRIAIHGWWVTSSVADVLDRSYQECRQLSRGRGAEVNNALSFSLNNLGNMEPLYIDGEGAMKLSR